MNPRRQLTAITRYVLGELPQRRRRRLFEQMSADADARAHFDVAVQGLRILEGHDAEWSPFELDLVHDRLLGDLAPRTNPWVAWVRRWRRAFWSGGALAASLAALLFWVRTDDSPAQFTVRGDDSAGPLALRALCGEPLRPAERGCEVTDTMSFAYRVAEDADPDRSLVLFGVDDRGRVLYYAPTPDDPSVLRPASGAWAPAQITVALEINHRPGMLRVFGVLLDRDRMVNHDDIERWASALTGEPSATSSGPTWTTYLHDDSNPPCSAPHDCPAVELAIELRATFGKTHP